MPFQIAVLNMKTKHNVFVDETTNQESFFVIGISNVVFLLLITILCAYYK